MEAALKLTIITALVAAALLSSPALAQGKSAGHRPDSAGPRSEGPNVAALAGGANAAHASPVARQHANPASMVGKMQVYAKLQQTLDDGNFEQAALDGEAVFLALYPAFETMSDADRMGALASDEGQALIAAQQALRSATADRDAALAVLGPNALTPEVKAYIDQLLND
jgi:hypothetical protein